MLDARFIAPVSLMLFEARSNLMAWSEGNELMPMMGSGLPSYPVTQLPSSATPGPLSPVLGPGSGEQCELLGFCFHGPVETEQ